MTRLVAVLAVVLGLSFSDVSIAAPVDVHMVSIPAAWRKVPAGKLKPVDGYSWYRAAIQIPDSWSDNDLLLNVEALDDARATFFNGTRVHAVGTFPPQYRSGLGESGRARIDSDLVKPGELNIIAIRVFQSDPRPNFSVAPPTLINSDRKEGLRLHGNWQYINHDAAKFASATEADFLKTVDDSKSQATPEFGIYESIEKIEDVDAFITKRDGDQPAMPPATAEKAFEVPEDLAFQLALSEPNVSQPLFMTWDERGRLWVLQYRQYPEVAGVSMVSRDVYLRSVYDKVPDPPPHGAKGRDRISIHEDTDGDGVYDEHSIFVDGLNIATSFAIGRGGVFVTNPPYLLFYPDENSDGQPDGDPEVLLEGFGLEDSHSVINSIRFGPDGWLYGAQGSTVTANVKRPGSAESPTRTMGQQIWRYHPESRRFEVFAEGGGNTFGVEIDSKGRIYSGHNGGNTRGFHYVQGGYYRKGFTKHGALSNPFAFGYFASMKHGDVPRFTHNFVVYEDDVLPEEYRGRLFGIEPLQGQVVMSHFRPHQSSFETEDISRVVKTDDQWFRPVDIKTGPDGCIYVADMYEQRIDHSSHYAGRIDRSNGRIYRLRPKTPVNQSTAVTDPKAELKSPRRSKRQTALRLIGDAATAAETTPEHPFHDMVMNSTGQDALEYLWALNLNQQLDEAVAVQLLQHADPDVRKWTVRLMCDRLYVPESFVGAMRDLSSKEGDIHVRKQLASSAARLPTDAALPIVSNLMRHDTDADDIHQPLLIWWALEKQISPETSDGIAQMFSGDLSESELFRQHIAERLAKRLSMAESRTVQVAAADLLNGINDKSLVLKGIEQSFKGRSLNTVPERLLEAIETAGGGSPLLRLRRGNAEAINLAIERVQDSKSPLDERLNLLAVFGETPREQFLDVLLKLLSDSHDEVVAAAISALQVYDDDRVPAAILKQVKTLPESGRRAAETLLASRLAWARNTVSRIKDGQLSAEDFSQNFPRQLMLHPDERLFEEVAELWPGLASSDAAKTVQDIERVTAILDAGSGNPKQGKPLFTKHCGRCHQLFKEGGHIGPDLTSFKRDDTYRMVQSIVGPSLEIREGFETFTAVTADGRLLTGFKADEDSQVLILRGTDGQNVVLAKDNIEELMQSKVSLMPQDVLKPFNDQQLRDLFAYLRSSQPVNY